MRNWPLILSTVLLSVCLQSKCAQNLEAEKTRGGSPAEDSSEAVEKLECDPSEADTCFTYVNENLLCHVLPTTGINCNLKTAKDMCSSLDDALNCTADIIDTDCAQSDGLPGFDNWLAGLRGVHTRLCRQGDFSLLDDLLKTSRCWNFRSFIRCVENNANLTHINNLLTINLDQHECNLLLMAVSVCNDKAEKNRVMCRGKADAVNEAVAAFFSASSCKKEVPAICKLQQPQELKAKSPQSKTGLAVSVTFAVLILSTCLLAFVLVKTDIITINFRCRFPRPGGDVVEEAREDYGRFL
ncbi:hypothetical protein SK128_019094 [Halocaridina rubra]|uniref:Uncharacterized protein n=1 Tax=Halocaridina rubra TaxID=373956 RepID=A0AAN8ZTA9_HALRR